MASKTYCDGVRRRDFLKVGVLSGTGFTLANYLQLAHAGQVDPKGKAKAAIFVHLQGGPSHMDTFDPKPDAPSEYRGEFSPIKTAVPGVEISEHFPKLAKCTDKFAILRGVSHTLAAHDLGTKYLITGNRPLPSLEFPGYGSVIAKEMPGSPDIPPFVAVPNTVQVPGYLGVKYAPFNTSSTPQAGRPYSVRGIALANGLTVEDIERRNNLLADLDSTFGQYEAKDDLLAGLDQFSEQAHSIISSRRSREAFDVSKESPTIAKLFGDSPLSQSCLLATRLVEAGVRFVSVGFGGWDTHAENFDRLKERQLPPLDDALAGLFTALDEKGLLESTTVFVTGEFGRTPKINPRAGRDHYPRAMFVLMGGGGVKGGQVIGASDDKAMGPADGEGIAPDDVAATFYHTLGVDFQKEYHTSTGRPVMIVRNGKVIKEALA